MTDINTPSDYWAHVAMIADCVVEDAQERGLDRDDGEIHDILHEHVDGDSLIIYYHGNEIVMRYTDNDEAWQDCYSNADMGEVLANEGIEKVRTIQAFFALGADVRERLDEAWDNAENQDADT